MIKILKTIIVAIAASQGKADRDSISEKSSQCLSKLGCNPLGAEKIPLPQGIGRRSLSVLANLLDTMRRRLEVLSATYPIDGRGELKLSSENGIVTMNISETAYDSNGNALGRPIVLRWKKTGSNYPTYTPSLQLPQPLLVLIGLILQRIQPYESFIRPNSSEISLTEFQNYDDETPLATLSYQSPGPITQNQEYGFEIITALLSRVYESIIPLPNSSFSNILYSSI